MLTTDEDISAGSLLRTLVPPACLVYRSPATPPASGFHATACRDKEVCQEFLLKICQNKETKHVAANVMSLSTKMTSTFPQSVETASG
eukprot:768496-Hanusia_phi.AAC.2